MPELHAPALRWHDGPNERRLLFAGNQSEPVAWGEHDVTGWQFHIALPGAPLSKPSRDMSRSAGEAFTSGVVEAWFKEIYA